MPVVKNIVKDASGGALDGLVTIELIIFDGANNPQSFQGFVDIPADTTSDYTINIPSQAAITNGIWSTTLKGNDEITDAYVIGVPTYYRVTEATSTVNRTYYIKVPTSGGPYWIGNIGAINPGTVAGSASLNALVDVTTVGVTNGQVLIFNTTSGLWEPGTIGINAFGSWTPSPTGPATMPATWTGIWEQLSAHTYHVSVGAVITGTWAGLTTANLFATLPNTWTRHATKSQHISGHITNGTTYWNVTGLVEPFSKSATAPNLRFLTPSITTTSYNYTFVNGVGTPFTFANGYSLEVSGTIRVA